jgi:hypothetical protein
MRFLPIRRCLHRNKTPPAHLITLPASLPSQLREQTSKMPPKTLTPDSTWLRLNQDEYFQPFFRQYLELLKFNLKQIQVMDHNGCFHHSYYTCGQDHDKRNREWTPFQILEQHCVESGYDIYEAQNIIQERIGRKLTCECELLKN